MRKISIKFLSLILILTIIFTFVQSFFFKTEVNAQSASYTQYIQSGISAFPESYQKKLAYLKYLHPNWQFKAYYTGIEWNELISQDIENACLKNTIYKTDLLDPQVICKCGRYGDAGYYCASAKTVNYYIDPRNFLGEAMVFQFLDLSNGSGVTRDVVARATSGTYLAYYVDDIMTAASEAKINPLHIVATIFQELGRTGTPKAISGTVPGYEGLYNFYNYGATDGAGAVERGLEKARGLNWTNPRYALVDGAKRVLASDYIGVGQTTKYFYKFDVVGNEILSESMGARTYSSSVFFNHQYMTNLRDPSSQAGSLYDIYAESGILDQNLTFTIPVYNNMPASPVPAPTTLSSSNLYYINSMKNWGITFRATAGGAGLGNLYKGTIVELLGNQGSWSRVRILCITTLGNGGWNYQEKIGYVSTEYLAKVGTDVPDYRGQVDMGSGNVGGNIQQGKAEYKLEESKQEMVMTPATKLEDVKKQYPNAVIKKADGTVVTNSNEFLGTGATVNIDGKVYTVVKLGDTTGDGLIDAMDMYQIIQYLLNNMSFKDPNRDAANVNGDLVIDAMDMYQIIQALLGNTQISVN